MDNKENLSNLKEIKEKVKTARKLEEDIEKYTAFIEENSVDELQIRKHKSGALRSYYYFDKNESTEINDLITEYLTDRVEELKEELSGLFK